METTFKFILQPGIKSAYCQTLDKYVTSTGLETDNQKVVGELCLTSGVFLVGSKDHGNMLKEQIRMDAFRKAQAVKRDEESKQAKIKEDAELANMSKSQIAQREQAKPTGAESAKVDEIRQSLEKEIADKKAVSQTFNKKGKHK